MKLTTKPASPMNQSPADEIGDAYSRLKEQDAINSRDKTDLRNRLESLMPAHGVKEGKGQHITGERWKVGFITPEDTALFDREGFLLSLTPTLRELVTSPALDEAKLKKAIAQKLVTRKQMAPFITTKPCTPRFDARPVTTRP